MHSFKNSCLSILCFLIMFKAVFWQHSGTAVATKNKNANADKSNYGRHFVLGFTEQHPSYLTSGYNEISITALEDSNVTITSPTFNSPLLSSFVKAGRVLHKKVSTQLRMKGTKIERKGIEINSTGDIAVFCLNYASATSDGYLAFPSDVVGKDYVIASYLPVEKLNFGVIAPSSGTVVRITLNADTSLTYQGNSYSKGQTFTVNLNKLQTFHLVHSADLSGTIITSDKPVVVLSGSTCSDVEPSACDHLVTFLLPVERWGRDYLLAPTGSLQKTSGDIFRVFAYENLTLRFNGNQKKNISKGEFFEIDVGNRLSSFVNCSQPCQVVQYVKGFVDSGTDVDPSIFALPSLRQFLNNYTIVLSGIPEYSHTITIVIEESQKDGLTINGLRFNARWQKITGTMYVWTVYDLSNTMKIAHGRSDVTFGVVVFGKRQHASYGYPGGFKFAAKIPKSEDSSEKCMAKLDIGFILDCSGSVSADNFEKMKQFVKDLTSYFTISHNQTRVSVMWFSSSAGIHISFKQHHRTKMDFDNAIDSLPYVGGGTNTAGALNLAYTDMFVSHNGARQTGAKKVLIILTDGYSDGSVDYPSQRLKDNGVIIFSVGIGSNVNVVELVTMASFPTDQRVIMLKNFNELSTLARKMSNDTCKASFYLVTCHKDFITVTFRRSNLPQSVDVDKLYLGRGACKASYNSTHVYVRTVLNGCGMNYHESDLRMFFSNFLSSSSRAALGAIITREQKFNFSFTCAFDRLRTVGTFQFQPARPRLDVRTSGVGNFSFFLNFFRDSSYVSTYQEDDYPVFKSLSDRIYVEYSVNTSNTEVVIQAKTCRATSSNRPYDAPQYLFIADGCDRDETIRHDTSGLRQRHRFSIQAFRFLVVHRFVYIHCDLLLCNRRQVNSTCVRSQSCHNRARRDVSEVGDGDRIYQLSFGPLMYQKETVVMKKGVALSDTSPNMILTGSLIGVAVLAGFLATALFVQIMRKRGSKNQQPSSIPRLLAMDNLAANGE